jgi:ABC-type polysaccharide/polyol phosphate export permease
MFVFYLMLGQLAWTFSASSTMISRASIVDNTGLLPTVLFPRAIMPTATVLFNFAQYLLTIAVLGTVSAPSPFDSEYWAGVRGRL